MVSFSDAEIEHYARHLILKEVGGPGQQALKRAKVLLVGAGGIGAPVGLYLAAAGVGQITLVDGDQVSRSNLQRQVIYQDQDVGAPKVTIAAARMQALNPHISVVTEGRYLAAEDLARLVPDHDLVIDGTDDFATRFLVSKACVATQKPLVSAALGAWTGQVGVFTGAPCYRCLVPDVPPEAETCARIGIVGALAGVIGTMAALEAIKVITGAGEPLYGRLLIFDGLRAQSRTVKVAADPTCPDCGGHD